MTAAPRRRAPAKTVGSYADCYPILDLALKHGGIRIPIGNAAKARTFRHRLYRARKLLQDEASASASPGTVSFTPYDALIIRLDPHTAVKEEPADLLLEVRAPEAEMLAAITDLEGNAIETEAESDELALAAAQVRRDLGLE